MKPGPCKNCARRHPGCHVKCEEYNAWRLDNEKIKDEKEKYREKKEWTYKMIRRHWDSLKGR